MIERVEAPPKQCLYCTRKQLSTAVLFPVLVRAMTSNLNCLPERSRRRDLELRHRRRQLEAQLDALRSTNSW